MRYTPEEYQSADLQILIHHIYEYKKGVRSMVLHTMNRAERCKAEQLLNEKGICFYTQIVNERKVNVFFGRPVCVEVVKSFGEKPLSDYSPEEDFMLGIMLGYDSGLQCERYIKQRGKLRQKLYLTESIESIGA